MDSQEIEDERFAGMYRDPRFIQKPKKAKKTQIDKRFEEALTSKTFNQIAKVDKYGRQVSKEDNTMKKFYKLEEEEGKKYYDEDGKFKWDQESDSSSSYGEELEGEDQSEEESDEEKVWDNIDDNAVEKEDVQIGKRLALTNMDWDNMKAVDLLHLFSSFCTGKMIIEKVEVYPSLYGLEQMKKDTLYGPPKELFTDEKSQKKKRKRKGKGKGKEEEEEDSELDWEEEEEDDEEGFDQKKLRQYEVNKMKYFYAVIHCNSASTALKLHSNYNGFEFELSNIALNLSFIADDLAFPQKPTQTATEVPNDYVFGQGQKLSKALNQTKISLTWDQNDPKREEKFKKLMKKDGKDEDYDEFIGNSSEEDDGPMTQEQIEEYRRKLLGDITIQKEGGDIEEVFRKRDLKERAGEKEEELEIKFNVGFGEDVGKKMISEKKEKKELEKEGNWETYQRKRKEKKREKKLLAKEKKTAQIKLSKMNPDSIEKDEEKRKQREQLELLVSSSKLDSLAGFQKDEKDRRFDLTSDMHNDPTHKEFKKLGRDQQNGLPTKRRKTK